MHWKLSIIVVFGFISLLIGFVTGYKIADRAWINWYMDATRREGEEDIAEW